MIHVYEKCPVLENSHFLLRLVEESDAKDLLEVYSDKNALPFFNSDNCNGDNFYYPTEERMLEAIKFWLWEYSNKVYVRFSIIDKTSNKAVGTIELFNRKSTDYFNNCGLLRLDVGSELEKCTSLCEILSIILEPAYQLFGCSMIATKAAIYAVERARALEEMGFQKVKEHLAGKYDTYRDYWIIRNSDNSHYHSKQDKQDF
ncbi:GNAT family N-acetyltransferase [Lacrimispora sp.]|uniref:GNAT family N-acetyltransferase n=1 Tax=Lacrimispora sp. TaxID=2719234 RepID=UPI002FDB0CD4